MADNLTERLAFTHRQWNSERQRWDYPLPAALAPALRELLKLNGEQRLDVIREFCHSCGCDDPTCQCGNDS